MSDCPHIDRPVSELRERVCPLEVVWGWGAIAELLGVSERTAQRYPKLHGLPVRRMGDADQAPTYLIVTEYNDWLVGGFLAADSEALDEEFKEQAERVRRKLSRGVRRTNIDPA